MDKNSTANAGDNGSIPGSGKIPHATATKPACCSYWRLSTLERMLHKRSHHTTTKESLRAATKTQHNQKNNKINNLKYNSKKKKVYTLTAWHIVRTIAFVIRITLITQQVNE